MATWKATAERLPERAMEAVLRVAITTLDLANAKGYRSMSMFFIWLIQARTGALVPCLSSSLTLPLSLGSATGRPRPRTGTPHGLPAHRCPQNIPVDMYQPNRSDWRRPHSSLNCLHAHSVPTSITHHDPTCTVGATSFRSLAALR